MQRRAELRALAPGLAVPPVHRRRRPFRLAIGVALGAGVGTAERNRQVGARHADAVVAARVHHHVIARGHVALDALRARRSRLVEVVLSRVERGGFVAAGAQGVAFGAQLERVRVVAVHAGDAALGHLGLQERAPDVDLLVLLAVGVVVRRRQQGGAMRVLERRAGPAALGDGRAPGMAGCANVHQRVGGGPVALRDLRLGRREFPRLVPAALQDEQTLVCFGRGRDPRLAVRPFREASPARGRPHE